jgi:hypothetical protein
LRSALRSERLTRLVPMGDILPDQSYTTVEEALIYHIDRPHPLD